MKTILSLSIAIALSGCALIPTYERPQVDTPEHYKTGKNQQASTIQVSEQWWKDFGDAELNSLVSSALLYNQDLLAAQARVKESQANARIAATALVPRIDGSGGYARQRTSQEVTPPGTPLISDVRTGAAQLSWEIDIWGKLAAQTKAARSQFLASQYNRDALQLSIASQVASTYFQLRALDDQLEITQWTLESYQKTEKLYEKQFKIGLISALDMNQIRSQTNSARARIPELRLAKEQTEHALSVLIGNSPEQIVNGNIKRGTALYKQKLQSIIPVGLPSELLTRRADIRAAEEQLIAAHANVGVARAAYLPTIGLTSSIGSQSLSLDNLFSAPARTWSFVGNLAMPIFNAGATGFNVTATKAKREQAVANYQKSIQNAFRETLDALSAHRNDKEIEEAIAAQLGNVKETTRLSKLRYQHGYSNYLSVLDSERTQYQLTIAIINARLSRLNAMVSLYKALGGGWDEQQSMPNTSKKAQENYKKDLSKDLK